MSSQTSSVSDPSDDQGPMLVVITSIWTGLAVAVVIMRLAVRINMIRNVGIDDWLMAFVTVIAIVGLGLVTAEVNQGGVGKHMADIPPEMIPTGLKLNFMTQLVYLWGLCFAKLSVGAALYRIASTNSWKYTILGLMLFTLLYNLITLILIVVQCDDIRVMWDPTIEGSCWPGIRIQHAGYANFVLNILADLAFALVVPLWMLWNINVSLRTKISLFGVLGLGCVVTSCGIIRLTLLPSYGVSGDWLYDTVDMAKWSALELTVSIIAGSLPSLRPLAKRCLGARGSYATGSAKKKDTTTAYGPGGGDASSRVRSQARKWQSLTSSGCRRSGPIGAAGTMGLGGNVLYDGESQLELRDARTSPSLELRSPLDLTPYMAHAEVTCEGVPNPVSHKFATTGITRTDQVTVTFEKA